MSVLFESAGLPGQYPAARFALKLKEDGVLDEVVSDLESAGKDPRREFLQMYVSRALHEAVLAHLPTLADSPADLGKLLREQYPLVADITDGELEVVMQQVLESQSSEPGEIPHTVIILDEIQQYVGDDSDRLDHVQNITELVSKSFDSKVMIVGTGQSALAGSPMLSKIQDRFKTRVQLSDKDVEQVTRELVLRKRPERVKELDDALDGVLGEISRHLVSSRIGARPQDTSALGLDYPILPVRRRLWEKMLRAVDVSGGAGQLRTQLRMTHEANQTVAHSSLPHVVGADYIYFDQMQGMLSGGVLSLDMSQRIIDYEDGTKQGELQQRVLALLFMLDKLPREAGADIEVRSNVDTITELLVTDLVEGSGQLKESVEQAIAKLIEDGVLTKLDDEYLLQTPAGAELQRKYREQRSRVRGERSRDVRHAKRGIEDCCQPRARRRIEDARAFGGTAQDRSSRRRRPTQRLRRGSARLGADRMVDERQVRRGRCSRGRRDRSHCLRVPAKGVSGGARRCSGESQGRRACAGKRTSSSDP